MEPVFRMQADELVLTVPAEGIAADWLERPLAAHGLAANPAASVLRIDAPPAWRWSTSDAAFLATLIADLRGRTRALQVRGLPKALESLLDLARAGTAAPDAPDPRHRPD